MAPRTPDVPCTSQLERDALLGTLRHGTPLGSTGYGFDQGTSGPLLIEAFADAHGTSELAVLKRRGPGSNLATMANEESLGYDIAAAMTVDHLLAAVGRRPDGSAAIELLHGTTLGKAGIDSAHSLEHALRDSWRMHAPQLAATDQHRLARIERQLVQTFKHVIGDPDFHEANGNWNPVDRRIGLNDHGRLGVGLRPEAPKMWSTFRYAEDTQIDEDANLMTLSLLPETREILSHTDRRAFDTGLDAAATYDRWYAPGGPFGTAARARLDRAVDTGTVPMSRS